MEYFNPSLDIIHSTTKLDLLADEVLIKRLHFIWLGSSLTLENAKNIPGWVKINQGCFYHIYIWYDSRLLSDLTLTLEFVEYLNTLSTDKMVYLCDVNQYPLFNDAKHRIYPKDVNDDFISDAYSYELGLTPRPFINPLLKEIKNYGMATDVLRMCILKLYGGFYMDLDMTPTRLCEYHKNNRIKSCPLRFCIALSHKPDYAKEEHDEEVYRNIYENYDEYYDYRAKYGDDKFDEEWYFEHIYEDEGIMSGLINNGLYYDPSIETSYIDLYFSKFKYNYARIMKHHYYGYFLTFRETTINASGPGIFIDLFAKSDPDHPELSRYKAVLRDIIEDSEQSTHSWIIVNKHIDVLAVLMYELFKDENEIDLTYDFLNKFDKDKIPTIEQKISLILYQFNAMLNVKVLLMYSATPTYRMIMDYLLKRILSDNQPSISLYIDFANAFINIPGPYIMSGLRGNYTDEERTQTELKFKQYMTPFIDKYIPNI